MNKKNSSSAVSSNSLGAAIKFKGKTLKAKSAGIGLAGGTYTIKSGPVKWGPEVPIKGEPAKVKFSRTKKQKIESLKSEPKKSLTEQIAEAKAAREASAPVVEPDLFGLPFPVQPAWKRVVTSKFLMFDAHFADLMDSDDARPDGWIKFGPHEIDVRTMKAEPFNKGGDLNLWRKDEDKGNDDIATVRWTHTIKLEDGLKVYLMLFN